MAKGGGESTECDIDVQRPTVIHLCLRCESPLLLIVALSGVPAHPRACVRNVKTFKRVWARPI